MGFRRVSGSTIPDMFQTGHYSEGYCGTYDVLIYVITILSRVRSRSLSLEVLAAEANRRAAVNPGV